MPKNIKNQQKRGKNQFSSIEPMITDYGDRKISNQNFSKIIAIPKMALTNCGIESQVNVKLVQSGKEKFLKLSPIERSETV